MKWVKKRNILLRWIILLRFKLMTFSHLYRYSNDVNVSTKSLQRHVYILKTAWYKYSQVFWKKCYCQAPPFFGWYWILFIIARISLIIVKQILRKFVQWYGQPRGGSRTAATSSMECFVIIVNRLQQPLTIITKHSILDVVAALDPSLGCPYHWTMI